MQIDDILQSIPLAPFTIPQIAWLAGAAGGLKIVGNRSPSWLWEDFYEDIYQMIRVVGHIEPVYPGTAPRDGDGQVGSALEALGGYVSVVGEMTPEGLYFRVPHTCQEAVIQLLNSLTVLGFHGEIVIPKLDLPAFLRLVPIEGPMAEWLVEEDFL